MWHTLTVFGKKVLELPREGDRGQPSEDVCLTRHSFLYCLKLFPFYSISRCHGLPMEQWLGLSGCRRLRVIFPGRPPRDTTPLYTQHPWKSGPLYTVVSWLVLPWSSSPPQMVNFQPSVCRKTSRADELQGDVGPGGSGTQGTRRPFPA